MLGIDLISPDPSTRYIPEHNDMYFTLCKHTACTFVILDKC